jgi:membrane-anchored protein YejM (alkaline phosphatase superfamily)
MVVAALAGVAVGIGFVAWRSMRWTLCGRLELGLGTVGLAGLAAFALTLLLAGPVAALTIPTSATLLGFAAALASGGGEPGAEPEDDPPWWPSFEDDLRRYERTRAPAGRR